MTLTLVPRRHHVPPAPPQPVHQGPHCVCSVKNHAVGEAVELAVAIELVEADLRGNRDLAAALRTRLEPCPHRSDAEVTA